jgi:iron complex outermembrane receptor protein
LADAQTSALTSTSYLPSAYTAFMGPPAALVAAGKYPALAAGQVLMNITGNAPGIHNQVARTVSLGGDISLPWVPNLNLSTTYYRIQLKGQIGMAPYYSASTYWGFYPNFITVNPTQAQIDSAIAISNTPVVNGCSPQPTCVYAIMDGRKNNLGNFKTAGLDIHADYSIDVGFGTLEAGTDGNIELDRQTSAGSSGYNDMTGNGYTTYRGRFWLGGTFGNFSTRINFNHTQGYKIDPAVGYVPQKKLDAFDTFDLFTGYDFHGNDLVTRDLAITLNISNVFNTSPPVYRAPPYNNSGALNAGYSGGTLGRLFQIGVSKKF